MRGKNYMLGRIKISGYKSLDGFEIKDITPFTVIAGANGSGKSNFFEAMEFVSKILTIGVHKSLREFGGFKNIFCRKRRKENRTTFNFEMDWPSGEEFLYIDRYVLRIKNLDTEPLVYEKFISNGSIVFEREGDKLIKKSKNSEAEALLGIIYKHLGGSQVLLSFYSGDKNSIYSVLSSVKKFAIDPNVARNSNKYNSSDDVLHANGSNLVSVLKRIESEYPDIAEEILDILTSLVPSLSKVTAQDSEIDNSRSLAFSEVGHRKVFPPHLISDGTIYLLSLLVAILSGHEGSTGLTLIEEPERGLHPKAIEEVCDIFKESASWLSPIIINTHSETAVRSISLKNLVFLSKVDGITKGMRPILLSDIDIPLDEAWLTNMLNGGLPQ